MRPERWFEACVVHELYAGCYACVGSNSCPAATSPVELLWQRAMIGREFILMCDRGTMWRLG